MMFLTNTKKFEVKGQSNQKEENLIEWDYHTLSRVQFRVFFIFLGRTQISFVVLKIGFSRGLFDLIRAHGATRQVPTENRLQRMRQSWPWRLSRLRWNNWANQPICFALSSLTFVQRKDQLQYSLYIYIYIIHFLYFHMIKINQYILLVLNICWNNGSLLLILCFCLHQLQHT